MLIMQEQHQFTSLIGAMLEKTIMVFRIPGLDILTEVMVNICQIVLLDNGDIT